MQRKKRKDPIFIDDVQIYFLRNHFLKNNSENWTPVDVHQQFNTLLKLDNLKNLYRTHLHYQLDKYCFEIKMRKNVGGKFKSITQQYSQMTNHFIGNGILQILAKLYASIPQIGSLARFIPHDFDQFLSRCFHEYDSKLADPSVTVLNPYAAEDMKQRVKFVIFIKKYLLPHFIQLLGILLLI